jgi:hypothetical protein
MNLLTRLYLGWRYRILLATLLLVLVVQPLSFGFSTPPQLFDAFLMLVTIALLLSFCQDKNKLLVAVAFGIPTGLLLFGGRLFAAQNTLVLIGHGLAVVFYFWAAVLIVASLFRSRAFALDSICGAIGGYLLLGMAWGVLYSMLDTVWPGSFDIGIRLAEQLQENDSRIHLFTYYSFITLTTVGYGDVNPLSLPARTCAWLEALAGQFYLAVVVAGLVGALLSRKSEGSGTDKH